MFSSPHLHAAMAGLLQASMMLRASCSSYNGILLAELEGEVARQVVGMARVKHPPPCCPVVSHTLPHIHFC